MSASADKRRQPPDGPVRVEHHQVVPEGAAGPSQLAVGRHGGRSLLDAGVKAVVGGERDDGGQIPRGFALGRHVDDVHDVTGARCRLGERLVGLLAGPRFAADGEGSAVALAEDDVVDHDFRLGAGQVVDQSGVYQARPRPAADDRLQVPDAGVVDGHQDDVPAGGRGIDRLLHPPVVGLQLHGVHEGNESREGGEKGRGRTEHDAEEQLAHGVQKGSTKDPAPWARALLAADGPGPRDCRRPARPSGRPRLFGAVGARVGARVVDK